MKQNDHYPEQATLALINLMKTYVSSNGFSQNSVKTKTGVDLSKYKPGSSTPLVLSVFKFACKMNIEPAWFMLLASKNILGEINNKHVEMIESHWYEFTDAMETALKIVVKNLSEQPFLHWFSDDPV